MSYTTSRGQISPLQIQDVQQPLLDCNTATSTPLMGLQKSKKTSFLTSLWQWTVLIGSLIGGTCSGPFFFYIQIDCQLLKSSWRHLAISLALIPIVYWEYTKQKDSFLYSRENLLNLKHWKTMLWASFGSTIWTVTTLISVNYTSMTQAYLFLGLHSIVIVIYNFLRGMTVSRSEIIGTLIATAGAILLASDGDFDSKEGMHDLSRIAFWERILFGDVVGIIGSIGACFYFTKNHELKYDFPLYLGITIMSTMGFLQISLTSLIFEGSTLGFDPKNGLFGLFSGEWFVIYIFIVVLTGYGGYVGYILAVKYFNPLIVSIVLTSDSAVVGILVFLLGWQSFPGPLTITGLLFIVPAIIIITCGRAHVLEAENDATNDKDKPKIKYQIDIK